MTDHRRARRVRTPFVPQVQETDCGPACLTAVLAALGQDVSLSAVSRECGDGRDGTSVADLARAASAHGATTSGLRLRPDGERPVAEGLARIPVPAIALMRRGHFVVLEGLTRRGQVAVNDPATGRRLRSVDGFTADFTGVVLTVARPDAGTGRSRRCGRVDATARPLRSWLAGEPRSSRLLAGVAALAGTAGLATGLVAALLARQLTEPGPRPGPGIWFALAGLALLSVATVWLDRRLRSAVQLAAGRRRGTALVDRLLHRPAAFFRSRFLGEVATRSQRVDSAAMLATSLLVGGAVHVGSIVGLAVTLAVLAPTAALVVLAGAAVTVAIELSGARRDEQEAAAMLSAQASQDGDVLSSLVSIEEVKAEAGAPALLDRWAAGQRYGQRLRTAAARRTQLRRRLTTALDGAVVSGLVVVPVLLGPGHAVTTPGLLMTTVVLAALLQTAVRGLLRVGLHERHQLRSTLRLVDDVLDPADDQIASTRPAAEHVPADPVRWSERVEPVGVRLTGVGYRFRAHRPAVLTGVDLDVPAGGCAFLTGPTGAGKSTLAGLIAGTLVADTGRVDRSGPGTVCLVPQRPVLLEGTVAENLLLGAELPDRDRRLAEALDAVALTAVVAARGGPDRARVTQDGANFSGGERQRLAIARALVRRPGLLVLDEATSAVEEPLAEAVYARLRASGATLVSVAHRLPPLADTDQVHHLVDGTLTPLVAPSVGGRTPADTR